MKKPSFIRQDNPVRAWSRRIVRGTRNRPDVKALQLERRIEILERLSDLPSRAASWSDQFVTSLTPHQFPGIGLDRVGSRHDGGYVLPMTLIKATTGVLSIGVGANNEADVALADLGLRVHAWDHTVEGLPVSHANITFHQMGLGAVPPTLQTLAEITDASFGPAVSGLVLMLDAEGAEWEALASADAAELQRFDVVAVELHDLGNLVVQVEPQLSVLRRLNEVFAPVAVHVNNHCAVWQLSGLELPDALEVTYVNRRLIDGVGVPSNAPDALFSPCCPDLPEVNASWAS